MAFFDILEHFNPIYNLKTLYLELTISSAVFAMNTRQLTGSKDLKPYAISYMGDNCFGATEPDTICSVCPVWNQCFTFPLSDKENPRSLTLCLVVHHRCLQGRQDPVVAATACIPLKELVQDFSPSAGPAEGKSLGLYISNPHAIPRGQVLVRIAIRHGLHLSLRLPFFRNSFTFITGSQQRNQQEYYSFRDKDSSFKDKEKKMLGWRIEMASMGGHQT